MKRTIFAGTALMLFVVGGSAMAQKHGGDQGKKQDRSAQGHPAGKKQDRPARAQPVKQQQQRVAKHEQRAIRNNQRVDQRTIVVQRQTAQLQQQRRGAQYRVEQKNAARLLQQQQRSKQQQRSQAARNSRVTYVNTAPRYRYIVGGHARQTNQYGADALRQAVNYGYREGLRAGRADRLNHWAPNYENSPEYRDANYGYSGSYVDRSDYNYYFRQGFRRGYDDGYYGRSEYGTSYNGTSSILGTVLSSILGLQAIR